jgi:hypothetical protein
MALQVVGGTEATSGISRLTKEYLYWIITSVNDLSGTTASMAFMEDAVTRPAPADWVDADIVDNPDNAAQKAIRILIGPGGDKELTPPTDATITYRAWVKLDTAVESIVRQAGTLIVR